MSRRVWNKNKQRKNERGVTLFVALLVVLFAAGYILLNLNVDTNRLRDEKAAQTAWLLQEVAEAARLFVRDADASTGLAAPFNGLYNRTALCAAPRAILPVTLVNARYLGDNIGSLDGAGNLITPFGQTIQIIAANSVIGTACTAPGLTGVAASAYIILQPGANTARGDLLAISEALNRRGMSTIAPLFDGGGNNISAACGAGPATIQWNTGCLTDGQYNALGVGGFALNTFGLPAWLTFRGDNRAIFRFNQPENPQAQDMVTDLRMAPFADVDGDGIQDVSPADGCNQVTIRGTNTVTVGVSPTDTVNVNSGVCDSDDDNAATNARRNINNVSAIASNRTIVETQLIDNNGAGPVAEARAFRIQGPSTITGSVRALGRNATPGTASWTGSNLNIGGGGVTVSPNGFGAAAPAANIAQNATTGILQADNATVNADASIEKITSAANQMNLADTNVTGSSGTNGFLANQLSGTVGDLTVTGDAVIGGTTSVSGATAISGSAPTAFSLATTKLTTTGTTSMTNTLQVGSDVSVLNNANIDTINVGTCYGEDCPDRTPDPGNPL